MAKLSKPVQIFEHPRGRAFWHIVSDGVAGEKDVHPYYSQEYVSALRDELKTSQAIANEYQQLMYHMDAGGDFFEFQRDKNNG